MKTLKYIMRSLKTVQFGSRSRRASFLTAGILGIFRGFKNGTNKEIGPKWAFGKGLILLAALIMLSLAAVPARAGGALTLDLHGDAHNPAEPTMGDHLRFWSTITNTGTKPISGLVAWISLVEIDPGNEQPVDLEDWSAHKAVTGATLGPGESLRTDWPMRLIKGGDYRVVISVTDRNHQTVFTSTTLEFHVRQKSGPAEQTGSASGHRHALALFGLMLAQTYRHRRRQKL